MWVEVCENEKYRGKTGHTTGNTNSNSNNDNDNDNYNESKEWSSQ